MQSEVILMKVAGRSGGSRESVTVLTAAVFGDPADGGRETVDVEVLAVKVGTLLVSEVLASLRTRLRVA